MYSRALLLLFIKLLTILSLITTTQILFSSISYRNILLRSLIRTRQQLPCERYVMKEVSRSNTRAVGTIKEVKEGVFYLLNIELTV